MLLPATACTKAARRAADTVIKFIGCRYGYAVLKQAGDRDGNRAISLMRTSDFTRGTSQETPGTIWWWWCGGEPKSRRQKRRKAATALLQYMKIYMHLPPLSAINLGYTYMRYFYSCLAFSAAFLGLTQPRSIGVDRMKTGSTVHIASPAKFPPQSALALLYPNRNDPV